MEVKIKPYIIRKFIEGYSITIKKMKIQVGEEIGGIKGLKYIILEGDDLLFGIENFISRYKSCRVRFHMIGPIEEVEFSNGLFIQSSGIISYTNVLDAIIFLDFLDKNYNF